MVLRWLAVGLVAAVGIAACASSGAAPDETDQGDLTVFAAASLRDVLVELRARWEAANPDVGLVVAFDGSNVLATQIAEGAPADIFLSADMERPARLAEDGLTAAAPIVFARNRVALVAPLGSNAVRTVIDLAGPGVAIVAAGSGVPITRYTEAALEQLSRTVPDAEGFLERVAANVVSREDNVRAALAKVELGEGDAAFVYATDVPGADGVREIPLPAAVDVRAEFAAVQISRRAAAERFIEWLLGSEAKAILAMAGFEDVAP